MFKNWQLIKNPQFLSNPHESLGKLLPHEVINYTKLYEDWIKIVESFLMANFQFFLTQTLQRVDQCASRIPKKYCMKY